MYQYQVIITASSLFQTINTIMNGFLTIITTRENPFQLGNIKLVGIRLQNRFPTSQTYHGNTLNIRMFLESHQRMDNNRTIIHMHKLLRNVLTHSVTRTSCYDKCIIHNFYIFILFFNYSCWISHNRTTIRHILENYGSSSNSHLITNTNASKNRCPRINFHIISNGRSSAFPIAQRHHLQTIEIFADSLCIEIRSISMFQMSTLSDARTPDIQSSLWRQEPRDKYRAVFAHAVVKKIAKRAFTCTRLDKIQDRRLLVLHLAQIGIYLLLMKQIQGNVRKHSHRRCRQDDGLRYWIHF